METQVKENKSESIKKLKESDFSVTKFTKDLSYGKKQAMSMLSFNHGVKIAVFVPVNLIHGYLK